MRLSGYAAPELPLANCSKYRNHALAIEAAKEIGAVIFCIVIPPVDQSPPQGNQNALLGARMFQQHLDRWIYIFGQHTNRCEVTDRHGSAGFATIRIVDFLNSAVLRGTTVRPTS
jgi:hypothetical protein